MSAQNTVKITAYLVDMEDYAAFAAARARHLGEARLASTAILIKGLLKPAWKFEIEAACCCAGLTGKSRSALIQRGFAGGRLGAARSNLRPIRDSAQGHWR